MNPGVPNCQALGATGAAGLDFLYQIDVFARWLLAGPCHFFALPLRNLMRNLGASSLLCDAVPNLECQRLSLGFGGYQPERVMKSVGRAALVSTRKIGEVGPHHRSSSGLI
jgi:hypothetical protein